MIKFRLNTAKESFPHFTATKVNVNLTRQWSYSTIKRPTRSLTVHSAYCHLRIALFISWFFIAHSLKKMEVRYKYSFLSFIFLLSLSICLSVGEWRHLWKLLMNCKTNHSPPNSIFSHTGCCELTLLMMLSKEGTFKSRLAFLTVCICATKIWGS